MPLLFRTPPTVISFKPGETLKTTREIIFSYVVTSGPITTREFKLEGTCYSQELQEHTVKYSVTINLNYVKTTLSTIKAWVHYFADGADKAGAITTAAGGTVFAAGLVADSTGIGTVAGVPLNVLGAGMMAIGGVFWGGGSYVKTLTKATVTSWDEQKEEFGKETCKHVAQKEIACNPELTYEETTITLANPSAPNFAPTASSKDEAVLNCVRKLISKF